MSKQTIQRRKRSLRPALEELEQIALLTAIAESLTHPGAFTINGSAEITPSGVRMTNALTQSSSVWFNNVQTSDYYTASFDFALSSPGGIGWADGFTFAMADASKTSGTAIGGMGAGIGYAGLSGYAIEFDTFYNASLGDPDYVHVGLDLNGSVVSAAVSKPLPFEIRGTGTVTASITYAFGAITVSIARPGGPSYQVLSAEVPRSAVPTTGRVGLTAATYSGEETAYINDFSLSSALPTLTALKSSTASAALGQSVTFSATVSDLVPGGATPSEGMVTFSDQNGVIASEAVENGVATFTTSSLPAGTDTITASYGGTTEFAPSIASTIVTISQQGDLRTMTALRASTASGVFGQSITFTATVSDVSPGGATPNGGTVTFRDQNGVIASETLANGVATFTTSSLPLGTDTITAAYGGTANFAPSSTAGTIVIISTASPTSGGAHRTKTLLTAKPRPSNIGQRVTVVATVEGVGRGGGKPIGDVTFYDGAIVLESDVALKGGKATLKTSSLIVGPHRIWVQYSGGGNFEASRSIFLNEKVRAGRSKHLVSMAEILD